jgi:hypothetical protein
MCDVLKVISGLVVAKHIGSKANAFDIQQRSVQCDSWLGHYLHEDFHDFPKSQIRARIVQ